jgi:hypothetical protein
MSPIPDYTFEAFVQTPGNALALQACQSLVAEDRTAAPSVLMVHGPPASGKTHLLQAIGNAALTNRPETRVRYTVLEEWINGLIDAIRFGRWPEFRAKYRNLDFLLLDNIHFLEDNDSAQKELFHTFEDLTNLGCRIACASAYPPSQIYPLADLVASRLAGGFVVGITAFSESERMDVLKKKAGSLGLVAPDSLLKQISREAPIDLRVAIGLLQQSALYVAHLGRKPTKDVVRAWVAERSSNHIVFLSYAWRDKKAVLAIDQWLRDKGARVLIDEREFWAGEDIQEHIIRTLRQASVVICVYSKNSASRPYPILERRLAEELQRGARTEEPRVVYLCLDNTPLPPQQAFRLAVRAKGRGFEDVCADLWRGITRTTGSPKRINLDHYRTQAPW